MADGEASGALCDTFHCGEGRKLVINPEVSVMLMIKPAICCVSKPVHLLLILTTYLYMIHINTLIVFKFSAVENIQFFSCLLHLSYFISLTGYSI
jgi:hypothetical protein